MHLILDNPLPGETSQARIKQIGMIVVMRKMQDEGLELTAANITKRTGMPRNSIDPTLGSLVKRELIAVSNRVASHGSGKINVYTFTSAFSETFKQPSKSPPRPRKS